MSANPQSRVVVVTGAASGIGEAIAVAFGEASDRVYLLDVDDDGAARVAGSIEGANAIHCDVTAEDSVSDAMGAIERDVDRIDVLVNNAGGFPAQRNLEDTTLEEWNAILELNLTSVFLMTRAALPLLRSSDAGKIVNVGSLAGQTANYRTAPPYAAAKAGVHSLTRVTAFELAAEGITANAVSPSAVMTDRIAGLRDEAERQATAATIPLARYQSPRELAEWVVFLASPEAGFMTGQTLSVNGGRFMQ